MHSCPPLVAVDVALTAVVEVVMLEEDSILNEKKLPDDDPVDEGLDDVGEYDPDEDMLPVLLEVGLGVVG
jgi:hypothetical protein